MMSEPRPIVGIALVAAVVVMGSCDDDDDLPPQPRTGGGGNVGGIGTGGASSVGGGSGGDSEHDAAEYTDSMSVDSGGTSDGRDCREKFIDRAVTDVVWYDFNCPDTSDPPGLECPSGGSKTSEQFLQFYEDGTYWWNVVNYWDDGTRYGYCRDPEVREGELTWEMMRCGEVRLTTGCGQNEAAILTDEGLRFFSHATHKMIARRPDEVREGRSWDPLAPSGCADSHPSAETGCQ